MMERTRSPIFFRRGCRSPSSCTRSGPIASIQATLPLIVEISPLCRGPRTAARGARRCGVRAVALWNSTKPRRSPRRAGRVDARSATAPRAPCRRRAVREARHREVDADLLASTRRGEAQQVAAASQPSSSAPSGAEERLAHHRCRPARGGAGGSASESMGTSAQPRTSASASAASSSTRFTQRGAERPGRKKHASATSRCAIAGRGRESGRGAAARGCRAGDRRRAGRPRWSNCRHRSSAISTGPLRHPLARARKPSARVGCVVSSRRTRWSAPTAPMNREIETMRPPVNGRVRISRHAPMRPHHASSFRGARSSRATRTRRLFIRGAPAASGDEESAGLSFEELRPCRRRGIRGGRRGDCRFLGRRQAPQYRIPGASQETERRRSLLRATRRPARRLRIPRATAGRRPSGMTGTASPTRPGQRSSTRITSLDGATFFALVSFQVLLPLDRARCPGTAGSGQPITRYET